MGESTEYYNFGGGINLSIEYRFPSMSIFNLHGELGYDIIPLKPGSSLSLVLLGGGGGISYEIVPKLTLKGNIIGGAYYGFFNDTRSTNAINPYLSANAGIYYNLIPSISLGLGASYINFFGLHYNGLGISLGATYHIGAVKKPKAEEKKLPLEPKPLEKEQAIAPDVKLEMSDIEFYKIFPVLFKYYDDHPVGRALLKNRTDDPITDLKVSLFVKQYMDNPKECSASFELQGGEKKEIELPALFNDKVLEITEGTKVSVRIAVEYTVNEERYTNEIIETVRIYDRNAVTWEDNRRAAAFVTAKDPVVLTFSKNIAGMIKEKENKAINENLRIAMALHDGLGLYGMSYMVDPKTPYQEYSIKSLAVDFLQFPKQTLKYRAGDCDDLSILYCALLESVGIETAFITIPGHIFMAFSLDLGPEEARNSFSRPDELIFRGGKAWVPVEVTKTKEGFLEAWEAGSREWRENIKNAQAVLYPIHKAWEMYEPVGLPGEASEIAKPPIDMIMEKYEEELTAFIDREIFPKVAEIQIEIGENEWSSKAVNKLGILYAKYGLFDRAEKEFDRILGRDKEYVPALVNAGNICYKKKNPEKALSYYERAYDANPDNPTVLLCVARAHHELENYGFSEKAYTRLRTIDPALAMKFSYLGLRGEEAARAASAGDIKEVVIWVEE